MKRVIQQLRFGQILSQLLYIHGTGGRLGKRQIIKLLQVLLEAIRINHSKEIMA